MINERAKAILDFCFVETEQEKWFKQDYAFDVKLKQLFMLDYNRAIKNEYDDWQDTSKECVALVLLLDQLSRNFFRNDSRAYDQDYKCRLIVNEAVDRGYLEELDKEKIHFLLLPLIHSEDLSDHIFGHKLVDAYLKNHKEYKNIKKAWDAHTAAIKKFGRYPHRNETLGRISSEEEKLFLKQPNSSW